VKDSRLRCHRSCFNAPLMSLIVGVGVGVDRHMTSRLILNNLTGRRVGHLPQLRKGEKKIDFWKGRNEIKALPLYSSLKFERN